MEINFFNGIISESDEKIVLVSLLGIIEALKNKSISIEEAENFLFSPRMVKKLQTGQCNKKIINIIEQGCELEDIASLMPDKLLTIVEELEQQTLEMLKDYPTFNKNNWIDR